MARKPITCGTALEQHAGERDAEVAPGDSAGKLRDRQRDVERQDDQRDADQHGGRNIDQRLHVPFDIELADQAVQHPGEDQHLEDESQRGRIVEVMLAGAPGHHQGGERKRQSLQREQVDERQDAPLRQHRERKQQQDRGEQIDDLQ